MINKFLLLDDKFIVKMHLRQLKHTYRACELFSKNKEQIEKMKKTPEFLDTFIEMNYMKHGFSKI